MTEQEIKQLAALLNFACNTIAKYRLQELVCVADISEQEAVAANKAAYYFREWFVSRYIKEIDTAELSTFGIEDWVKVLREWVA
ncbi:hypothetical protein ACQ4M3_09650 [Leptolyngbya sp. AN03gr2]|uniref:hypothetical protein n=1 Tax=Leptolyngbya sp. AN03gr2 TaxID=3423364 RepID=UPI003D31B3EB